MTSPRLVDINVSLIHHPTKPGNVDFDPESSVRVSNSKGGRHKFQFDNRGHPGFTVRFNIVDNQFGYRFPDCPDDALWVCPIDSEDDPCPDRECHWPGFHAVSVESDDDGERNRRLVVCNPNRESQLFAFTLRLTRDSDPKKFILYDPIGDDRNGSAR